jgi:hypothetical protein
MQGCNSADGKFPMYDIELTDEQRAILRFIHRGGCLATVIIEGARIREIPGLLIEGRQQFQNQLDSLELKGLIGRDKAERGGLADYYLTPKGLRRLGE